MTRIKICGITSEIDAQHAAVAGADAIGLVFYDKSPRFVSIEKAQAIVKSLAPFVSVVGLFVNAEVKWIHTVIKQLPLSLLQFHGDETEQDCAQYGLPYIKAFRVKEGLNLHECMSSYPSASGFLLDAFQEGALGGTGHTFNWDLIPETLQKPLILAGGLNPDNVSRAILKIKPYAVDVSSGVEMAPGKKDMSKVNAFCQNVMRQNNA